MEPTKQHTPTSMHIVYGAAIIVLALVLMGIICVLGNIQIPYISKLYAPEVIPQPLSFSNYRSSTASTTATSSVPVAAQNP